MVATPSSEDRSQSLANARTVTIVVGLSCAVIYLFTASYASGSGDVNATNVLSWQLATSGDSTFTEDTFPPLDQHPSRATWIIESADGGEVVARLPGAVVAAIPAYWLLGEDQFSAMPGAVTAAVLTAVAVMLFAAAIRTRMPLRNAALASLVFALTTPVWSVAADGMWPHTVTVLGLCGMAWAASRERWWLVGLFGGVAIWGRLHTVVIVALVGLLVGLARRDPAVVVRVAVPSSILLALESLWTKALYGFWNPMAPYGLGVGDNPFNTAGGGSGLVNQLGFWVAPGRGLLVWSPLILLLLPALARSWRLLPDWSKALLWGGIAYTVVQGMRNPFEGGDSFYGYRLTLELLASAAPALALSVTLMGRLARAAFGPVLTFQTLVIAVGAVHSGVASPADEAWTRHTLLSVLVEMPVLLGGLVVTSLVIGILGQRIWSNPSLEKSPADEQVPIPKR